VEDILPDIYTSASFSEREARAAYDNRDQRLGESAMRIKWELVSLPS
jgi:hypothetical protein